MIQLPLKDHDYSGTDNVIDIQLVRAQHLHCREVSSSLPDT